MRKLVKKITTKVVGVTFNNEDGSSRQDNIALLSIDDEVNLELFYYNDEPAYLVTDIYGNGIGVLNKELAAEIYENYDCKGCEFKAWVSDIRGGEDGKNYGCSIKIIIYDENYENKNTYTPSRTQAVNPNPTVMATPPIQTKQTETSEPKAEETPAKQSQSTVKTAPTKNQKAYKLASVLMYIVGPIFIVLGLLLLFAVPATGVISIVLGAAFLFAAKKYKKMITSKKLFIVIAVLMVLLFATIIATPTPDSDTTTDAGATTSAEVTTTEAATTKPTTEPTTEAISLEFKNALGDAKSYLRYTAFSKEGLKGQLEYEGYTAEACEYAVENCGADWNEQAAKKAQSYLDYSSFSRKGLYDQLEYEGFTAEQIEYGLKAVGY